MHLEDLEKLLLNIEKNELLILFIKILIKADFDNVHLEQIAKTSIDLIDDEYSVSFIDFLNGIL